MIRRLKKDVLNQLPPKKRQKVEIQTDKKIINQIKLLLSKSKDKMENFIIKEIPEYKIEENENNNFIEKEEKNKKKTEEGEEDMLSYFNKTFSLTGRANTPDRYEIMNVLGEDVVKERLSRI